MWDRRRERGGRGTARRRLGASVDKVTRTAMGDDFVDETGRERGRGCRRRAEAMGRKRGSSPP